MADNESWEDYNRRRAQEMAQWQADEDRLHQPVHPPSDWDAVWDRQRNPPPEPFRFPVVDYSEDYERGPSEPVDLAGCASTLVFIPSLVVWPILYPLAT